MGARVEGKTKKKSIKANVTSKFNSKRKASRMGKKVKKGQMGPNTEFITRSSALKKLQITLKDFRRLCILKGIYPRVPVKGLKGNDKVYYDIKDISYIMHEPLLQKFRDFKTFMKKIRKAAGRNQVGEARRKDEMKPQITLDHLVKERYPRFIDALRDLDDALCMVHLFASMPSTGRITTERTANCGRLVRQWQHYIAKSRTLQKVFVSVKGVYFQAEIMGEPVTWLAPHQFTQAIPKEIDVRVMLTFLEFYEVYLQFVLFKLYASQNLQYPPKVDQQLDAEGCFLMALKSDQIEAQTTDAAPVAVAAVEAPVQTKSNKASTKASAASLSTLPKLLKELGNQEDEDDEEEEELGLLAAPLNEALQGNTTFGGAGSARAVNDEDEDETEQRVFATQSTDPLKRLFSNLVFFINREVPLEWMQLCTLAFGGKVAWDGPMSPYSVDDARITHQIVDRPQQGIQSSSREYIQPQWIFDCINAQILLPVHNYRPGSKLPPHLSPFVDDDKEGYMPKYRAEIRKLQAQRNGESSAVPTITNGSTGEEKDADSADEEDEEMQQTKATAGKKTAAAKADKRKAAVETANAAQKKQKVAAPASEEEEEEESEEESGSDQSEEEEEEEEEQQELLKSLTGKKAGKAGPKGVVFQPDQEDDAEEEGEGNKLSKLMMSKKTKRLYGRMQHGIEEKKAVVRTLETKRAAQEKAEKTGTGKKARK